MKERNREGYGWHKITMPDIPSRILIVYRAEGLLFFSIANKFLLPRFGKKVSYDDNYSKYIHAVADFLAFLEEYEGLMFEYDYGKLTLSMAQDYMDFYCTTVTEATGERPGERTVLRRRVHITRFLMNMKRFETAEMQEGIALLETFDPCDYMRLLSEPKVLEASLTELGHQINAFLTQYQLTKRKLNSANQKIAMLSDREMDATSELPNEIEQLKKELTDAKEEIAEKNRIIEKINMLAAKRVLRENHMATMMIERDPRADAITYLDDSKLKEELLRRASGKRFKGN